MSMLEKMPTMNELAPARDAFERKASSAVIWVKRHSSRRPFAFALAAIVAISLLFSTTYHSGSLHSNLSSYMQPSTQDDESQAVLRLLIPATSTNALLCQTLLSAAVLGYPAPVLINWGNAAKFDLHHPYKSHIQKVSGILEYLQSLPAQNDNDVVLIIDGFDVWFQLRPEVILERYHAVNQAANERIIETYGAELAKKHDMRQTVVFGADKKCFPQRTNAPACYAVPNSTLPEDVFGPKTDMKLAEMLEVGDEITRPRWLNSGTAMGPVADMRAIFAGAQARYEKHNDGDRDQFYFGELFGNQEWFRRSRMPFDLTDTSLQPRLARPVQPNASPVFDEGQQIDYHIGLDYKSVLFQTNTFANADSEWITYNGTTDIDGVLEQHKIESPLPSQLPKDILHSRPPFESPSAPDNDTDISITWKDIPLATNLRSKSIPSMVHINGDKSFLFHWWGRMWFQPFGKHLLEGVNRRDRVQLPMSSYGKGDGGHYTSIPDVDSWWRVPGQSAGFFTKNMERMDWDGVCKQWNANIMTNGRDPW